MAESAIPVIKWTSYRTWTKSPNQGHHSRLEGNACTLALQNERCCAVSHFLRKGEGPNFASISASLGAMSSSSCSGTSTLLTNVGATGPETWPCLEPVVCMDEPMQTEQQRSSILEAPSPPICTCSYTCTSRSFHHVSGAVRHNGRELERPHAATSAQNLAHALTSAANLDIDIRAGVRNRICVFLCLLFPAFSFWTMRHCICKILHLIVLFRGKQVCACTTSFSSCPSVKDARHWTHAAPRTSTAASSLAPSALRACMQW